MAEVKMQDLEQIKNQKVINGKRLHTVLPTNSWKDERAFIVGGGNSLKDFDFSLLENEKVIACNRAIEYIPNAPLMLAQDARLWSMYETNSLGSNSKEAYDNFKGLKAWVQCQEFPYPEDIHIVDLQYGSFNWDGKLEAGIPNGNNTGLNAISVAVALGANPIYLLGIDLKWTGGKSHFHSGYDVGTHKDDDYKEAFLPSFKHVAWQLNNKADIINLNLDSELDCFKKSTWEDEIE